MSPILYTALVGLAMVIVVGCALKLFDINSDFSPILRKVSVPFAIIISLITIIAFAIPLTSEFYDFGTFFVMAFLSGIAYLVIGYALSYFIDKYKSMPKKDKKSKPAVAQLTTLDALGALVTGFGFGACFYSKDVGFLTAVALALFLIIEKAAIVFRYQGEWSRQQIINNLIITLLIIPIAGAAVAAISSSSLRTGATYLAFGCGYLLYRSAYHLFFIAKSFKKS